MGEIDDDQRRSVGHILSAGQHLLDLVNEVLNLSRIESGRMTISPEPVELADLANEAVDLTRPLADDRAIRITAGLESCHHLVVADRQRLKQVLLNLLSNAVKYNRDGGEVELSCLGRTRTDCASSSETPGRGSRERSWTSCSSPSSGSGRI